MMSRGVLVHFSTGIDFSKKQVAGAHVYAKVWVVKTTIPAPPPPAHTTGHDSQAEAWRTFGTIGFEEYRRLILARQGLSPVDIGVRYA